MATGEVVIIVFEKKTVQVIYGIIMSPRLVGVVHGPTLAAARDQISQAMPYADLLEIRLDLFDPKDLDEIKQLPRKKPFLFTFRKKSQGGGRDLSEQDRLALFEHALVHEPEYCDIETDTELTFFDRIKNKYPKMQIIGSFHALEKMPEDLEACFEKMQKPQISFYKMAVATPSANDALQLLAFAKEHEHLTCIGLGPDASFSRILAPIIGVDFCYASIEESSNGLGQVSLKTLCDVYQFKSKNQETKIYALLGDPVDKSVGHLFHNRLFSGEAIYIKIHLAIPELTRFFSLMRKFPFRGFSITMPLKEQLHRYLTRIEPVTALIGSVNTIVIEGEHLIGHNTDGRAVVAVLLQRLKTLKDRKVTLIGAGGVARAIAYELVQQGASVLAVNRTFERAEVLAKAFGCKAGKLDELEDSQAEILINTVPVDLLFSPELFSHSQIVIDLVYWEQETPLLKMAKERGATCIGGMEIFEEQAREQQKIWFGKK